MASTNAHNRQPITRLTEFGATYFLTWRIAPNQPTLTAAERDLVANTLRHFENSRYTLHAWVVMDDHVHVVVTPVAPATMDAISHSWRTFTALALVRDFGRTAPIWQRGRHDRVVRAGGEFDEKILYVRQNPWRRWPECLDYAAPAAGKRPSFSSCFRRWRGPM